MALEPIAAKNILYDDHSQADEHGIGDTHKPKTAQTITTEDETADDGLQQIVGETHAAKETKMTKGSANGSKGVPCRNYSRRDHHENKEVVDRCEPS